MSHVIQNIKSVDKTTWKNLVFAMTVLAFGFLATYAAASWWYA